MKLVKRRKLNFPLTRRDPLLGWKVAFVSPLYWHQLIPKLCKKSSNLQDVYQFGVATGGTLKDLVRLFSDTRIEVTQFNGFDTFTGMPLETLESITNPTWAEPGVFDQRIFRGLDSATEVVAEIKTEISELSNIPVNLIIGEFESSLAKIDLVQEKFKPAIYVDIDVDFYTGAFQALDFMFANKLILPGTVIGYDDWGGTKGWQLMHSGESRAHKEITLKYKVKYKKCFQFNWHHHRSPGVENIQRLYLVESIGTEATLDEQIDGTFYGKSFKQNFSPGEWPPIY